MKIPSSLQIVPTTSFFAVMSLPSRIQTEDAFVRRDAKKDKRSYRDDIYERTLSQGMSEMNDPQDGF